MAVDTSLLTSYTWAEIATAAKQAMMSAAVGGGVLKIKNREITRITVSEATALYRLAQEQIALEGQDTGGGMTLVKFGQPA